MAKEIALIFSDAHLQRRTWKHRPILGDAYHAWKQIFDYALEKNVLTLFGLGDLFDDRVNEPSPLVFAEEQCWRLRKAKRGHVLHYIEGQHELDETRVLKTAEMMGVANHMHKQVVTLPSGLKVYGLNYQPADKLKEELAQIPEGTDVLAAHQVWSEFMGDIALPQGSFGDVPVVSQIWTGDYHKPVYETKKYRGKDGQKLGVLSPGPTHQCPDITSPNDCYFYVVRDDGTIGQRRLNTRQFVEFYFESEAKLEEFLKDLPMYLDGSAEYAADYNLPEVLHKPLWRIVHTNLVSDAERRIVTAVDNRAHLFFKEQRSKVEEAAAVTAKALSEAVTLESCLTEEVDPQDRPEVYQLCLRLLHAGETKDNVAQELARWKKEVLDGA